MSQSLTLASAIRGVLHDALQSDPSVHLLGEMVGRHGGVAGTCAGLRDTFGDDRVIDTPIADHGTLGMAVGMALGGRKVVVEISSTGRLPAVFEVLADAAAIAARGDFALTLVVRVPYGAEAAGLDSAVGTHIGHIPGLRIACAADVAQAAGLLRTALASSGPTVLLEPRALYGDRGRDPGTPAPFAARVLRPGHHITLAAWGTGVQAALAAAETLQGEGLSAEVLDLVSVAPVDRDTLGESVARTGRLVVVHSGDPALAHAVQNIGLDKAFLYLESPLASAADTSAEVAATARATVTY